MTPVPARAQPQLGIERVVKLAGQHLSRSVRIATFDAVVHSSPGFACQTAHVSTVAKLTHAR